MLVYSPYGEGMDVHTVTRAEMACHTCVRGAQVRPARVCACERGQRDGRKSHISGNYILYVCAGARYMELRKKCVLQVVIPVIVAVPVFNSVIFTLAIV